MKPITKIIYIIGVVLICIGSYYCGTKEKTWENDLDTCKEAYENASDSKEECKSQYNLIEEDECEEQ
jgi:hypothetical protein